MIITQFNNVNDNIRKNMQKSAVRYLRQQEEQRRADMEELQRRVKEARDKANQMRLEGIMNRLRAGVKLSDSELAFLKRNNAELYGQARRVLAAREQMESQMKAAKSKQQTRAIGMTMTMSAMAGLRGDSPAPMRDESAMLAAQYSDAYHRYTQTAEYKRKEDYDCRNCRRRGRIRKLDVRV